MLGIMCNWITWKFVVGTSTYLLSWNLSFIGAAAVVEHTYSQDEVSTPKLLPCPRYIGDIRTPHLSTPRRAKRCLNMTARVIVKQRKRINYLLRKLRVARKKVQRVQDLIEYLKETRDISETAADHLLVGFSLFLNECLDFFVWLYSVCNDP